MTINFKVYKASYISKVSIDKERDSYRIISNIKENDPIFSNLMSKWKITYLNEKQCQITYDVEFEFRNLLYQQASQYFICIIGEKMTNAFEKRVNEENFKKNKNSQKHNETKKKSLNLLPTSDILESLIEKIHYFYKLNKISQYDFEVIIEIIDQNLDFKELLVQAYILFCKNNHNYKDGDNKLLHYLKDISLMNKIIIVN